MARRGPSIFTPNGPRRRAEGNTVIRAYAGDDGSVVATPARAPE